MGEYYCLIAGLPEIDINDSAPRIELTDFVEQCREVLTHGDRKLFSLFFLRYDCENLVRMLKDENSEINSLGNYTVEQLHDLITSAREMTFNVHRFPAFMSKFARDYAYNKDVEEYYAEDEILLQFFEYAIAHSDNSTMRKWWKMQLDINNILTAFIVRRMGLDLSKYIKGDGEVQEMILENKTKDFDLGLQFDYAKELMLIADESDPLKKERMIDALKWIWLDEQTVHEYFSVDVLFAYLCKLEMLTRWEKLVPERGKEAFRQIIENIRGEAKVPKEFM